MIAIAVVASGVVVLAAAPFWAPHLGLGLPLPPPPGVRVHLPGGHHVNVYDEGRGRPVVLVHGLPGSAHFWTPLPEQLVRAGFRVIRYDRVGYGRSSRRTGHEPHTIESNATELIGLLAARQLRNPVVIGWSYGGAVAQVAAAMAPSEIGALLLLGSDGPASQPSPAFRTWFEWTLPLRHWGIRSGFPAALGVRLHARQAFHGQAPARWTDDALSVVSPEGVARTWTKESIEFDARAFRSQDIAVPVAILHGTHDTSVTLQTAHDLHRRIAGSTLVTLAGAGHMLPNTHAGVIVEELQRLARPLPQVDDATPW